MINYIYVDLALDLTATKASQQMSYFTQISQEIVMQANGIE